MWRSSEGACVCVHWMWDTWSDSINKLSVQVSLILYSCVYIQYVQYVHAMGVILLLACTWSVVPTVLIRSSTQWHLWPRVAVESEEFFQLVFQLVVPMFCCFAPQTLHSNSACKSCHEDGTYVQYFTGQSCEWDMKRTSNTQHLMPTSNTQCIKRTSNTTPHAHKQHSMHETHEQHSTPDAHKQHSMHETPCHVMKVGCTVFHRTVMWMGHGDLSPMSHIKIISPCQYICAIQTSV